MKVLLFFLKKKSHLLYSFAARVLDRIENFFQYQICISEKSGIRAKLTIPPFFLDTLTSLGFGSCGAGMCLWYQESELTASFLRSPRLRSHPCGFTPYPKSHLSIATLVPQFHMGHGSTPSGCGSLWVGKFSVIAPGNFSKFLLRAYTSRHSRLDQSLEINPYHIYRE